MIQVYLYLGLKLNQNHILSTQRAIQRYPPKKKHAHVMCVSISRQIAAFQIVVKILL